MSNTIYLYLKTHNVTGLKYLGKTVQNPFEYQGSGKHWKRHIKKHGYDVTTEILFETTCNDEFKRVGLEYSKKWNIAESKEFANLKLEEGDGGDNSHNIHYEKIPYCDIAKKISKTKSDPLWKETIGREAKRKISKTKSDPLWKETIGREASRKQVANTDYEEVRRKQVTNTNYALVGKRVSETKSDPLWKETIGKEASRKQVANTDYEEVSRKISKTKADPLWKETIGKETARKISESAKRRKKIVCECCGNMYSSAMYSRWHGNKCKRGNL